MERSWADEAPVLRVKMPLYPLAVRNHRLFLQTGSGKTAGYLSFRDDRLYYIVIPLLEHRRAQVKIEISEKQDRRNSRNPHRYKNLDFALKIPLHQEETFPESIIKRNRMERLNGKDQAFFSCIEFGVNTKK